MKNFDLTKYLSNNPLLTESKKIIKENKSASSSFDNMMNTQKYNLLKKLGGEDRDDEFGYKDLADDDFDNLPKELQDKLNSHFSKSLKENKMTKSSLKQKIKEMILAEVSVDGLPWQGEEIKDDKIELTQGNFYDYKDPGDGEFKTDLKYIGQARSGEHIFDDGEYYILVDDKDIEDLITNTIEDNAIGESNIDEAKKKDEEEVDVDFATGNGEENIDTPESETDIEVNTDEVDPTIKAVQDALTQAQSAAEELNDPKLSKQIGNTITQFTRTHISNKGVEPMNEEEQFSSHEDVLDYTEIMVNLNSEIEKLGNNKFIQQDEELKAAVDKLWDAFHEIEYLTDNILGIGDDDNDGGPEHGNLDEKYNLNESVKRILEEKENTNKFRKFKTGDKVTYLGKPKNGFETGKSYEVKTVKSNSTFEYSITIKNGGKLLNIKNPKDIK